MDWKYFKPPVREYFFIFALALAFAANLLFDKTGYILVVVAGLAVLPTIWDAIRSFTKIKITIDVFNTFAIVVSFLTLEFRSTGFIALMLTFARLLEFYTESRTKNAIAELMKLKPQTAYRETDGTVEEIDVEAVKAGDILLVKSGFRVPVDGVVVFGTSEVNESSVTGESALMEKVVGDEVMSSTLVEAGILKIRATRVGRDSTIERMAALMREAALHKSKSEKMADRFAGMFLPFIALFGLGVFIVTRNLAMTAALFLVACADDMAVAIPLAMTASLGRAARRGVIIKGGEWLDVLARMKTLILDKTGTLTYGSLSIAKIERDPAIEERTFWERLAVAEKFSEHPVGKMIYREAARRFEHVPDPDEYRVYKGSGVFARYGKNEVILGSDAIIESLKLPVPAKAEHKSSSAFHVFFDKRYAGTITVADKPRPEAAKSLRQLERLGVENIMMFTGDNRETAAAMAKKLGIGKFRAGMSPEDKVREMEKAIEEEGTVGMVGDGINDAPALARADVGIAMGGGGTAIAVEAADVVILTDNLARLPEMIQLSRRTLSVIRGDVAIWFVSNLVGFALVLTGLAGPAFAAFYNFATDFLPLINSSRLFKNRQHLKII